GTTPGALRDLLVLYVLVRRQSRQSQTVVQNLRRECTADPGSSGALIQMKIGRADKAWRVVGRGYEAGSARKTPRSTTHPSWRYPIRTEREIGVPTVRELHQGDLRSRRSGDRSENVVANVDHAGGCCTW